MAGIELAGPNWLASVGWSHQLVDKQLVNNQLADPTKWLTSNWLTSNRLNKKGKDHESLVETNML